MNFFTHILRTKKRISFLFSLFSRKAAVLSVIIMLLIGFFSAGLFWLEYTGRDEAIASKYPTLRFVNYLPKVLDIFYLPLMVKGPSVPQYEITVDGQYLKELNEVVPKGEICCNCLPKAADQYGPATLKYEGKEYGVKIKVRGDCSNHWSYAKKSWRVKLDDNDALAGIKVFDLIIPDDREFVAEYLNNYRARKFGLAVPEMKVVALRINGQYYGAYLWEEKTNSEMLEKNQQPPDVNIYKDRIISDRLFYNSALWQKDNSDPVAKVDNYAELDFLLDLINNASDEEFFEKIPQLVDLDNFYRWNILSMLAGSYHQDFAHNMIIYFDNTVGKFKFIPADVGLSTFPPTDIIYNPLVTRIIKNPDFVSARNKVLWDYVNNKDNLKDDLKFFDQAYNQMRWAVYRDRKSTYSNFYFDKKAKIRREQYANLFAEAEDILKAGEASVKVDLSANLPSSTKLFYPLAKFEFLVDNFSGALLNKVEVTLKPEVGLRGDLALYHDSNQNQILDNADKKVANLVVLGNQATASNVNQELLAERVIPEDIDYSSQDFETGAGPLMKEIRLKLTSYDFYLVSDRQQSSVPVDIFDTFKFDLKNAVTGQDMDYRDIYLDKTTFSNFGDTFAAPVDFIRQYPEFRLVGTELVLPLGVYSFKENIIIPTSVSKLTIAVGSILNLGPGVSIFSYAPIQAKGTAAFPIQIKRQYPASPWGVIVIVDRQDNLSEFEHVQVSGGSTAYVNGIYVSGQLSFYSSDVKISNSEFSQASGDDSLNVKKARVEITDSIFYDNGFDAIDLDWVTPKSKIVGNHFFANGNDAMDISGSAMLIKNNKVMSSGDKCISVGEHSDALIENNLFKSCNIGIAVKDLSAPEIKNNTIIDNKDQGVGVYQKKPIFGGAHPILDKNIIWGNKTQVFTDEFSSITINHSDIEGGWAGEGNIEIKPEFNSDYIVQNLDFGFGK